MKKALSVVSFSFVILLSFAYPGKYEPLVRQQDKGIVKQTAPSLPDPKDFQTTIDGKQTDLYILKNKKGMTAAVTNYGGRLVGLIVPDKDGQWRDVVVGFKTLDEYRGPSDGAFGATIGRYGNRIGGGKFTLDGKEYTLFKNAGRNTLHGGKKSFMTVVWDAKQLNESTLQLSYLSKDGEEGFPGNLNVVVTYSITADNALKIDYTATTDKKTVVNFTNHSYFNLNGEGSGTVLNHLLQINADQTTEVDSTLVPTGKYLTVAGTPLDFTKPKTLGADIDNKDNQQFKYGHGYDHNYVLKGKGLKHAATAVGDQSRIKMDVYTEEPAMQLYTANFMRGRNTFKSGAKIEPRTAFCLETQHHPDSPNQPNFPTTVLNPGKKFRSTTTYKFSIAK